MLFQMNLKDLKINTPLENSFFALFFYLSPSKGETLDSVIQFFQKNNLKMEPLKNKKSSNIYIIKNANFCVQSNHAFSPLEFRNLVALLPSNIIVVAIFYKNEIWNCSRLQKLAANSSSALSFTNNVSPFLKQSKIFWKTLEKINF